MIISSIVWLLVVLVLVTIPFINKQVLRFEVSVKIAMRMTKRYTTRELIQIRLCVCVCVRE